MPSPSLGSLEVGAEGVRELLGHALVTDGGSSITPPVPAARAAPLAVLLLALPLAGLG
ncbi:hypothetical protein ACLESO_18845 [Pyxidicoccus sp. 3LG]